MKNIVAVLSLSVMMLVSGSAWALSQNPKLIACLEKASQAANLNDPTLVGGGVDYKKLNEGQCVCYKDAKNAQMVKILQCA